ncbi:MAG: flagellar export protein FliJ [Planctomycetaceae bacterium]
MERRGVEVVLRVRRLARDQVAVRLAERLRCEREAEAQSGQCRGAVLQAMQHAREAEGVAAVSPERLAWHRAHVVELERARLAADEALELAQRELAAVRAEWVAAQREVEGLEQIAARHAAEHRAEQSRREQRELDELAGAASRRTA